MRQKVKVQCNECGMAVFLDPLEFERRRDPQYNYEHVLCPKCCKRVNWKSICCKSCPDKIICSGGYNKAFKKWLDRMDGV